MDIFREHSAEDMLRVGVALIVLFSVLLGILYSIWGGFLMITSGGSEEKVKPAVNHIRHAFIGMIVLLLVIFTAPKVIDFFGLPYGDVLRPHSIFETIQKLSSSLFSPPISGPVDFGASPSSETLPSDFSDL